MFNERNVKVGNRIIGDGKPVFVIAEIGINHNGSLELAKKMITGAVAAGADAVKFQKRTPELCVPKDQWNIERDTPWGRITYIDYRHKVEFEIKEYEDIDGFCKHHGIMWFASCWDEEAINFMEKFEPPLYKVPSASLNDMLLLAKLKETGRPIMLSSGMSNTEEVENAVNFFGIGKLMLAQSTSTYPCKVNELNLRVIETYRAKYPAIPIGYSGHETGLAPSWASAVLGANFIERHLTLDRAMWGTDQAASVEVGGFIRLIQNLRDIEQALGDGVKRVYESEIPIRKKLRRVQ